ncbi:SUMF1/EgtB/PvdO family nonheme iron enzyme [Thalassotalea sp. Y01]|uniref:formylglycine-generating enzyme family protein n=1 Tax=Thalassotalea sp. Y01 TaxID=2729613 RepID=UPI00200709CA|nr:SUMF1/EgtB/PvdO family nonheme iron enzyme [Thalassotalea sp. Y01]
MQHSYRYVEMKGRLLGVCLLSCTFSVNALSNVEEQQEKLTQLPQNPQKPQQQEPAQQTQPEQNKVAEISEQSLSEETIEDPSAQDKSLQQPAELSDAMVERLMKDMIWVEGGEFTMGSDHVDANSREKPPHQVTVDGFYMGRTEVTQELFLAVMGWNFSYFPCDLCPVNNISWINMQQFINRLNEATGKVFRLPSEAEWAFAAKGGNQSKGFLFSGSDTIDDVAWYAGNANRKLQPVGLKRGNELGLHDMTGNVWEFCQDDMSRTVYSDKPRDNPMYIVTTDIKQVSLKVLRGGGYEFSDKESYVYRRDGATSNVRMPDIGFRLALDKQ